jgi:predicted GNAT family acetyltransferase
MVEHYSIHEFVKWFPLHKDEFMPETAQKMQSTYLWNPKLLVGSKLFIFIYKNGSQYAGFRTYSIDHKTIFFDYTSVEEKMQRNGIGFNLSCLAIEEGLKQNCSIVTASVSIAAKKLIAKLKLKYPQLEFIIKNSEGDQ